MGKNVLNVCRPIRKIICSPNRSRKQNIKAIINDYLEKYQRHNVIEHRYYKNLKSFDDALQKAATARMVDGKCHPHQRRVGYKQMQVFADMLKLKKSDIKSSISFDNLIDTIDEVGKMIPGVGELTIYDTSCRIGSFLGLTPDYIYLHAGTRIGASVLGLDVNSKHIQPSDLPDDFQVLKPHEIEDCLCIYKEELKQLTSLQ